MTGHGCLAHTCPRSCPFMPPAAVALPPHILPPAAPRLAVSFLPLLAGFGLRGFAGRTLNLWFAVGLGHYGLRFPDAVALIVDYTLLSPLVAALRAGSTCCRLPLYIALARLRRYLLAVVYALKRAVTLLGCPFILLPRGYAFRCPLDSCCRYAV